MKFLDLCPVVDFGLFRLRRNKINMVCPKFTTAFVYPQFYYTLIQPKMVVNPAPFAIIQIVLLNF